MTTPIASGFRDLQWYCAPDSWKDLPGTREGRDGRWSISDDHQTLKIFPPAKKDFWRKTFYDPILIKDDGPVMYAELDANKTQKYTIETKFQLTAMRQFDQAGLMIRLSPEHWIKTGIEMVDGVPRLSCVVTNVYSDWSTQVYPKDENAGEEGNSVVVSAHIRVHVRGSSFVVEARMPGNQEWNFVRIAHLSRGAKVNEDPLAEYNKKTFTGPSPPPGKLWAGVFACSPEDQHGGNSVFSKFVINPASSFDHNADGNHE